MNNPYKTDSEISPIFNKDVDSFIFKIDFENEINEQNFKAFYHLIYNSHIINYATFTKEYGIDEENVVELFKLISSSKFRKHILFLNILNNLEKLSRIFPLYESVLTIEKVKPLIEKHMYFLRKSIQNKFSDLNLEEMQRIYMETKYLLDSNELVIFEHFFSFEFKLGQFLPVMVPILYGLAKSFKAVTF